MKHKRSLISVAMATIMLVSLCAVCASTSVSAAPSSPIRISGALASAPAGIVGAPAVCSRPGTYSIDLFIRGTDNALWWTHWDSRTWSAWKSLGGVLTSSPAATPLTSGVIHVCVRGNNGALYEIVTNTGGTEWGAWAKVGGELLAGTGPAACWSGSVLSLFVTGTNHQLYWFTSSNGWKSLGGYLTSSPAAVAYISAGGAIYVAARGGNGAYYVILYYSGVWHDWFSFGGQILAGTGPALVSSSRLFVTGTNHQLYWLSSEAGWKPLGGYLTSSPAATSLAAGTIDVFAVGTNGALYSRWTADGGTYWNPWYRVFW